VVSPPSARGRLARRRILVTGGSGFIGRHLVQQLEADGAEVTVLVRDRNNARHHVLEEVAEARRHRQCMVADLTDSPATIRAVREADPEQVVHLAAVGVTDPLINVDDALRTNLHGTLNLLKACFEARQGSYDVQRVVVARTPGETSPMNAYTASKRAAWTFCQMYGLTLGWPVVGAMVFQAYGPGQPATALVPSAIRAALADNTFAMTSGRQKRDWIYIDDVVQGVIAALQVPLVPGTTVDLGTGVATSVYEVARMIFRIAQSRGTLAAGLLQERPGDGDHRLAGLDESRRLLNWEPATPLDEGLRQTISWSLDNPAT
jgi:nucleoside-diphosphate-sugar epimerase